MLEQLKQEVREANLELYLKGIVIYTWGVMLAGLTANPEMS